MAVLDLDNTLESCVGPAKCYTVYSTFATCLSHNFWAGWKPHSSVLSASEPCWYYIIPSWFVPSGLSNTSSCFNCPENLLVTFLTSPISFLLPSSICTPLSLFSFLSSYFILLSFSPILALSLSPSPSSHLPSFVLHFSPSPLPPIYHPAFILFLPSLYFLCSSAKRPTVLRTGPLVSLHLLMRETYGTDKWVISSKVFLSLSGILERVSPW